MFVPIPRQRPLHSRQRPFFILITLLLLGMIIITAPSTLPTPSYLADGSNLQQIKLPLAFVPNRGQTDPAIQFQAHDLGGTLYFSEKEVTLSLPGAENGTNHIIRFQFVGAEQDVALREGKTLPGVVNYLIGDQQTEWLTDLPTYGSIVYESLYPGIDLSYDGASGRLKGTYLVAPGANPNLIQWRHAGANSVTADAAGNLIITLPNTEATILEAAPVAWQEINGQKQLVPVSYAVGNNGAISFTLGQYNTNLPLTIDPTIVYSVALGGGSIEAGTGIAVDSAGNSYITGFTSSDDYPTENPFQTNEPGFDVFVSKINAAGTGLVYSTYIGGSGIDTGHAITVDDNGIAYVVGDTDSTNFPTQNPVQGSNGGSLITNDAFILALNAAGNGLVYSTYLGGSSIESADAIALDGSGNVYVTGMTGSDDFPTQQAYDSSLGGVTDAFVTKLNSSGSAWVYSTYLGGGGEDLGFGIAVDGDNAYVVGNTLSTNFPTENPYQSDKDGVTDLFITKMNSAGTGLEYSTYLGGSDGEVGYGIAVHNGQAHVTGYTKSSDYPTQSPIQPTYGGGDEDAIVSVLSATGDSLMFSTYLGGDGRDEGRAIAIDSAGDIYLTGETVSSDFPTANPLQAAHVGQADAFVTKISSYALEYSTYLGGSESDYGYGIALDDAGHAYVVGHTDSANFPSSAIGNSPLGKTDLFVIKIEDTGDQVVPPPSGPELSGSYKKVSQLQAGPDEELVYTIGLHNSGTDDALVTVTDDIPGELAYVPNSVTGGGVYDAGTLTWSDVTVPAGDEVLLTFAAVTSSVSESVIVVNTAVITPATIDPLERSAAVLLMPENVGEDVIPPIVTDLVIDEQDVLTDPQVTLHISATDNVAVEEMYLKEWALDTTPFPHWQEVQSSGWVPYQETYPWTLEETSGTHFIFAWVADAADNLSIPTLKAGDYASLLLSGETVPRHGMVPYLVYYEADTTVTATLTPSSGDADLYVWYPHSHLLPDQKSVNGDTAVDSVTFVTPEAGAYLFLVHGYTEATYDLSITPGGGTQTSATDNSLSQIAASDQATDKTELTSEPVLTVSGLDPLGIVTTPEIFNIYLPTIAVNQP